MVCVCVCACVHVCVCACVRVLVRGARDGSNQFTGCRPGKDLLQRRREGGREGAAIRTPGEGVSR